ncbi:hypothetical protein LTR78_004439 [Recurvomyces mirabilis]|uniref:Uncharacterized protein n=1 Tax=Recurvomyces mirabilis TaxID=574656 RepID=A0AAE0WPZ6_9PEZI|nr:hypothetical protein LTR78_004439 [Recurvomyces mirabilis]KAK5155895.1 hypothetical protein LTS14_005461 [Recurvomyces mirabilis]
MLGLEAWDPVNLLATNKFQSRKQLMFEIMVTRSKRIRTTSEKLANYAHRLSSKRQSKDAFLGLSVLDYLGPYGMVA